jgi:hypothetical protein
MNVTVTAAPLPANFKGNPQQLIEALLDRLEVTVDGTSFVISDIQPAGNEGPWLKNGTQWWVWNEGTSQYVPLDISASITQQIFIGDVASGPPDNTKYSLWLQLNGTTVNGLFYFAGTTAGWVTEPNVLVAGAITPIMFQQQPPGSLFTFDVNKNPIVLQPGSPGTFLTSTGNGVTWSSPASTKGVPVFIAPVVLETATGSLTAGQWNTISTLIANGVPITASAIILGTTAGAVNILSNASLLMRPNSAGAQYTLATTRTAGGGDPAVTSFNQGIYPVANSSGVLSFDWSVDTTGNWSGSSIVLLGYIS